MLKGGAKVDSFEVRLFDVDFDELTVILNVNDAAALRVNVGDRVKVRFGQKEANARVSLSRTYVGKGEVGVCRGLGDVLGLTEGERIVLEPVMFPRSSEYIHKKMRGEELSAGEIRSIIRDIARRELSRVEVAAFVLAEQFKGMTDSEIESLTLAMIESGERIEFKERAFDKHSIGGVPGNKVSLLIVPIVAASGLLIPKTSSKAITSPSGTADTMEVLAPVNFKAEEFKEIAERTRGIIAWGGSLNIVPTDDLIIRVEHPLMIDPVPQMIASILAKKVAVGIDNMVLDIPIGEGCKTRDEEEARNLAVKFIKIARKLGIKMQCGITYGGQPVGHTIGPALEAKEALEALAGKGPLSLVEKSTALAGMILEMGEAAMAGRGQEVAREILRSGRALSKMREIIEAQGGDSRVKPSDIPLGSHVTTVNAESDGYVVRVDNEAIKLVARAAGAPVDKGAGVILRFKRGYKVSRGDTLMEIYSERESRLSKAAALAAELVPVQIEGMLLGKI